MCFILDSLWNGDPECYTTPNIHLIPGTLLGADGTAESSAPNRTVTGTTKIRNGHFLAKWGEMGMFLAKWGRNGQFFGEMGMFHIGIAYNHHANTSFNCLGFSISNK